MIFQFEFMKRALAIGFMLGLIIPCIGVVVVFKKLSMVGDALSHTSLAGVAFGMLIGINPVVGATVFCIIAALGIDIIRKRFPNNSEISIAIIMSFGIGLAGVLSGLITNTTGFNSFLFGSIVAITDNEYLAVTMTSVAVLIAFLVLYKELMYISFDEESARLSGVPVKWVNLIFTILTALTVAVAARTVGALIVSSLMVIPVACAMQFEKGYFKTVVLSILFGVIFTVLGIFVSFHIGLRPGGTIVLTSVFALVIILIIKSWCIKG